jgi:sec-independent protein translocase protein TatA
MAALFFASIGPMEWALIAVVIILLFGARKLPELARSLGSSVTEFKKGLKSGDEKPQDSTKSPDGPGR